MLTDSESGVWIEWQSRDGFHCSTMSRAPAAKSRQFGGWGVDDLNSWGLELSRGSFIHMSDSSFGMTERLGSAGTAPLRLTGSFSMWLGCPRAWQLDSKRTRQNLWPSLRSHWTSLSPYSIDQSRCKTVRPKGRNIDPTSQRIFRGPHTGSLHPGAEALRVASPSPSKHICSSQQATDVINNGEEAICQRLWHSCREEYRPGYHGKDKDSKWTLGLLQKAEAQLSQHRYARGQSSSLWYDAVTKV